MAAADLVLRARRAVVDDAEVAVTVLVTDGRVVGLEPFDAPLPDGAETVVLAELERRLHNDDATERAETVGQLREIALLRLRQAVS